MTKGEEIWLEDYLEHGDGQKAVALAFPECSEASRPSRSSHLKTKLANEIDQRLLAGYRKDAPQAVRIIKDLMQNAMQEAVKLKAAQDWLSRAGHDAAFKVEHSQKEETHEELQARLKSALAELTQDELTPFLKTLANGGMDKEIQTLMELTTDKPQ